MTLATNEQEWRNRHAARLIALGWDEINAHDDTNGAEVDLAVEPEDAANEEHSYAGVNEGPNRQ
jgi:hypothetical protein